MSLVQMSLQGAVLIVVIAVIRALAMEKLPKWTFQVLWAIAVFRLLVPLAIESPLSVYGAVQNLERPATEAVVISANPQEAIAQPLMVPSEREDTEGLLVEEERTLSAPAFSVSFPWHALWLGIAASLSATFLISHIRWRRMYGLALPWQTVRAGGREVSIRVSDHAQAPVTYGVFRPVVVLPRDILAQKETRDYVLAHELAHIKHCDALKKWLLLAAVCLHWFNPLVWMLWVMASRDMERASDEAVLRSFGGDMRTAYAMLLIRLEEKRTHATPLASHFSQNAAEERITSIMKYQKKSPLGIVLSIVLVLTTAVAFATSSPAEAPPRSPTRSADNSILVPEQFAMYEPFGLTVDTENNQLLYEGNVVRYFWDVVANNGETTAEGNYKGAVLAVGDLRGTVDLEVGRDSQGRIETLWELPQSVYDTRTERYPEGDPMYVLGDGTSVATYRVEWWTAEGYEAYMETSLEEVQALVGHSGHYYDGWGTWTQEKMDEFTAMFEDDLAKIQSGERLESKTVEGRVGMNLVIAMEEPFRAENYSAPPEDMRIPFLSEASMNLPTYPARVQIPGQEEFIFDDFYSPQHRYQSIKTLLEDSVAEGLLTEAQADELLKPFE